MNKKAFPLVSVIIRSINRPELQIALDSVAAQSYPNIEIVVVNACGTGHRALDAKYGAHVTHLVDTGESLHRSRAANMGLEAARGELLIFLDDDDWFLPGHIGMLVDALEMHPEAVGAYDVIECLEQDETGEWVQKYLYNQPFNRTRLLFENYIPMHALLFRRAVLDRGCRVEERLDVYEDWDFWVQLSALGDFVFVNAPGAIYRLGANTGFGINGDDAAVFKGLLAFFRKWRQLWSDEELVEIAKSAKFRTMYRGLQKLLNQQSLELVEQKEAARVALEALRDEMGAVHSKVMVFHQRAAHAGMQATALIRQRDELLKQTLVLERQIHDLTHSQSWRITRPLRVLMRIVRGGDPTLQRYWSRLWSNKVKPDDMPAIVAGESSLRWQLAQRVEVFTMPVSASPLVSIIVLPADDVLLSFSCLKSIADTTQRIALEVIVLDRETSDPLTQMLRQVQGIRVVPVMSSCDRETAWSFGVTQAQGDYLVFLRASVLVTEGWLESLLSVCFSFPDAGMVGPLLLQPDERVQTAGCIVWRHGMVAPYGVGGDSDAPEYRYVRSVDACPDACRLVRRDVFEHINGFGDASYIFPFCEADLAFRMRQANAGVYFQPAAKLVDFGENAETAYRVNSTEAELAHIQFRKHWAEELRYQFDHQANVWLARDQGRMKRILVMDIVMLTPDQDSGSLRMFKLLEELVGLKVKVIFATRFLERREPYLSQLQQAGVEVLYQPHLTEINPYLAQYGDFIDAVMLSRVAVAEGLCDEVRKLAPKAMLIFDTVDLHFLREQRMAELAGDAALARAAEARKQIELGLMRKSDVTLVVSEFEQALLQQECPDIRVEVLSNIHDIHGCAAGFDEREGVLFIGGFNHPPNVDAVLYYIREVLPLVVRELGSVKTWIIGSNPTPEVLALASENVIVEGFVEDVAPHFTRARMSVAPLRYGAGVKGKVNMSMAYGVPAVVTPVAAEGMSLTHGVDAMVGENAERFAQCVIQLYRDKALWEALSQNGMLNIERHFSRGNARNTLQKILFEVSE